MSQECQPRARLLSLPWEVRRPIIVEVLRHQRQKTPVFSRKFIERRVRLRNCFDNSFPEITSFYVARHKNRYLHGNALRATNRQLRYETNLVIQKGLETGSLDHLPFTLDIMVVKDIGVFPTWMSFPYQAKHIKKLTISLRIIRPGAVPDEWVETARYSDDEFYARWENSPIRWNVIVMGVLLYAFGHFSVKPDPALPPIRRRSDEPSATKEPTQDTKEVAGDSKSNNKQKPKDKATKAEPNARSNLIDHKSDTFDAYVLRKPSYVVDELLIEYHNYEYNTESKPIPPSNQDTSTRESRFYKVGYLQFGRDIFRDFDPNDPNKDNEDLAYERRWIYNGTYTCHQLKDTIGNLFYNRQEPSMRYTVYGPYLEMLARSAGQVLESHCTGTNAPVIEKHPSNWIDRGYKRTSYLDPARYSKATVRRNLARELAKDSPDEDIVHDLRLLQIRRSHGWVEEDD